MSSRKSAVSNLRKKLIDSAPKPPTSRAWWAKFSSAELDEIKQLCKEREIEGSELNVLYPSRISLARFFAKEFSTEVSSRTILAFIDDMCNEQNS